MLPTSKQQATTINTSEKRESLLSSRTIIIIISFVFFYSFVQTLAGQYERWPHGPTLESGTYYLFTWSSL
jgi:hypothetical protein